MKYLVTLDFLNEEKRQIETCEIEVETADIAGAADLFRNYANYPVYPGPCVSLKIQQKDLY